MQLSMNIASSTPNSADPASVPSPSDSVLGFGLYS